MTVQMQCENGGMVECGSVRISSFPHFRIFALPYFHNLTLHRGSILMETVIVMPILLLLIFGIIQTAMIWTGKQLTVYAAYCAARAITVVRAPESEEPDDGSWTNESDRESAAEQDEAAARAAKMALAWVCFYDNNADEIPKRIPIPGWGTVDQSGSMDKRVTVKVLKRGVEAPYVSVRVTFKMSLMMPVMGVDSLMAKAAAGNGREIYTGPDFYRNLDKASKGADRLDDGLPYITFTETCAIPMPYSTRNFPRGAYDWMDTDRRRFR